MTVEDCNFLLLCGYVECDRCGCWIRYNLLLEHLMEIHKVKLMVEGPYR